MVATALADLLEAEFGIAPLLLLLFNQPAVALLGFVVE
jgi:hypothetical protein